MLIIRYVIALCVDENVRNRIGFSDHFVVKDEIDRLECIAYDQLHLLVVVFCCDFFEDLGELQCQVIDAELVLECSGKLTDHF